MHSNSQEPAQHAFVSKALVLKSVDEEKREVDFIASTDAIDSWGEIVAQNWRLERFNANPVILFAHNSRELPIGQAVRCAVERGVLVCRIRFATEEANPLAEKVWQSIRQKTLRAVSVGFRPHSVRLELRDDVEVWILDDNELHEISVVPVPANPDALARMKSAARTRGTSTSSTRGESDGIEPARENGATGRTAQPAEPDLGDFFDGHPLSAEVDAGDEVERALLLTPTARTRDEVLAARRTATAVAEVHQRARVADGTDLGAIYDRQPRGDAERAFDLGDFLDQGGIE